MTLKLSSYVDLKAGISMHPGHSTLAMMLGLNEEDLYKDVKCPQMFMPAIDDHENAKIGGLVTILPTVLVADVPKALPIRGSLINDITSKGKGDQGFHG